MQRRGNESRRPGARRGRVRKKGSPITQGGHNRTVTPRARVCRRLFPVDVTERGQEIVSNWRAVQGIKDPSKLSWLFLSSTSSLIPSLPPSLFTTTPLYPLFLSRRAVSSRTCRADPGIVVQIQQKPTLPCLCFSYPYPSP